MNENESANPLETQGEALMAYPTCGYEDHETHCTMLLRETGLEKTFFVDVATSRTIQIDLDIPFDLNMTTQFYETLDIFRRMLVNGKAASYRHLRSKGGRTHIVIALSWDMPQSERIAWQAAFGSDFKREALSLAYAALGQKSPVLLYSSKEEVAPVISILPYESKTKNVL